LEKLGINFINIKDIRKHKLIVDNVIDTTGNTKLISLGFDLLGKKGKLILVGQPKKNEILKIKDPLRLFNPPSDHIKISTSDGGLFDPKKQMKTIYDLMFKNLKSFKFIISHTIKLSEINTGIKFIEKGKAIRVAIKF